MEDSSFESRLGPALAGALERKGFTKLTLVQETVLDPALSDRDLRITSQTGSGKTVAVGFALRGLVEGDCAAERGVARPRVVVVAPTRELAKQVEAELAWLFASLGAQVASTTGGAAYRDERRALARGPAVIVGTPGRLLDHLRRGAIDPIQIAAIVLDEADRMLDLGFRDDLEAILELVPEGHRTHLVSATFPREVRALADRVQRDPVHVEGTRLGAANVDIEHVLHLVDPSERVAATINVLLADPDAQTLVFARTRADVAEIARELDGAGFGVRSLSGEMDQVARNRALAAFKRGNLRVLVATDVAARGIDVADIGRVIHVEPPSDADMYTHRSGRTGRAGRKGTSSVLVPPAALRRTVQLLERAKVAFRIEPIPTADAIRAANDQQLFEDLTRDDPEEHVEADARKVALAQRLLEESELQRVLLRLLARSKYTGPAEPREVRAIEAPDLRPRPTRSREGAPPRAPRADSAERWVLFRVTWGHLHGADARRLLAVACRRGGIRGGDVGAIRVGPTSSVIEVASEHAEAFAIAAAKPDARNPRIAIVRDVAGVAPRSDAPRGGGARPRKSWGDKPSSAKYRPGPNGRGAPSKKRRSD